MNTSFLEGVLYNSHQTSYSVGSRFIFESKAETIDKAQISHCISCISSHMSNDELYGDKPHASDQIASRRLQLAGQFPPSGTQHPAAGALRPHTWSERMRLTKEDFHRCPHSRRGVQQHCVWRGRVVGRPDER